MDFMPHEPCLQMYRETPIISIIDKSIDVVPPLVNEDPTEWKFYAGELSSDQLFTDLRTMVVPPVIAESIQIESPGCNTFQRFSLALKHNPNAKRVLLGDTFRPSRFLNLQRTKSERPRPGHLSSQSILENGGLLSMSDYKGSNIVDIPKYGRLVTDCAKMRVFADLINRLHAEKHRCLVFC